MRSQWPVFYVIMPLDSIYSERNSQDCLTFYIFFFKGTSPTPTQHRHIEKPKPGIIRFRLLLELDFSLSHAIHSTHSRDDIENKSREKKKNQIFCFFFLSFCCAGLRPSDSVDGCSGVLNAEVKVSASFAVM